MKSSENITHILGRYMINVLLILLIVSAVGLGVFYLRGFRMLSVQTASMKPVLHIGDVLVVAPAQTRLLKPGEIISYRSLYRPDQIISHRLVKVYPGSDMLVTHGDALSKPDPPFSADRVVGRGIAILPKLGRFTNFAKKPYGLALFVIMPAFLIVSCELYRLHKSLTAKSYRLY